MYVKALLVAAGLIWAPVLAIPGVSNEIRARVDDEVQQRPQGRFARPIEVEDEDEEENNAGEAAPPDEDALFPSALLPNVIFPTGALTTLYSPFPAIPAIISIISSLLGPNAAPTNTAIVLPASLVTSHLSSLTATSTPRVSVPTLPSLPTLPTITALPTVLSSARPLSTSLPSGLLSGVPTSVIPTIRPTTSVTPVSITSVRPPSILPLPILSSILTAVSPECPLSFISVTITSTATVYVDYPASASFNLTLPSLTLPGLNGTLPTLPPLANLTTGGLPVLPSIFNGSRPLLPTVLNLTTGGLPALPTLPSLNVSISVSASVGLSVGVSATAINRTIIVLPTLPPLPSLSVPPLPGINISSIPAILPTGGLLNSSFPPLPTGGVLESTLSLPSLNATVGASISVSISLPPVSVPTISIPTVTFPTITIPSLSVPSLSIPRPIVSSRPSLLPNITFPPLPTLQTSLAPIASPLTTIGGGVSLSISTSLVIATTVTPISTGALASLPTVAVPTSLTNTVGPVAPTGVPSTGSVHCGVKAAALGDYFLATYVWNMFNIPVTLEGCFQFCKAWTAAGCRSYSFYLEPGLGVPRCDLYAGVVAYEVVEIDPSQPYTWYDLSCGDPVQFLPL